MKNNNEQGWGAVHGAPLLDLPPLCDVKHRGTRVMRTGLYGSSFRGGLTDDNTRLFVLLDDSLLDYVGWLTQPFSTVGGPFNTLQYEQAIPKVIFWPWPDMGTPQESFPIAVKRIEHILHLHQQGQEVEVACHGGHGRTGTLLAILAGVEKGWATQDVVTSLRANYCDDAIEHEAQEDFAEMVVAHLRGEKYRPPAYRVTPATRRERKGGKGKAKVIAG